MSIKTTLIVDLYYRSYNFEKLTGICKKKVLVNKKITLNLYCMINNSNPRPLVYIKISCWSEESMQATFIVDL